MAKTALEALGTSIFSEMTALAVKHQAVNLSQGFPDFEGPPSVVDDAVNALRGGHNQYARSMGVLPLVNAVASHQRRRYGIELDPLSQIVCTAGATEALAATMIGLLDPGDEVLLLEPFYDGYPAVVAMCQAVAKVATLRWPDFKLPLAELSSLITSRTKMVVLTTPHNPTGRVFSIGELDGLAALCVQHDLIAVCDEVYEHLTYGVPHVPLATRPGMRDRTVTISSTGKTFSYTGWKVGWAAGPASLIAGVQRAHQFLTFCASTPLHVAMAGALDRLDDDYVGELQRSYRGKRDRLVEMLQDTGFVVSVPDGAYFALADFSELSALDDRPFAHELVEKAGVAAIPSSAFYSVDVDTGRKLLRFAFCKQDATLEEAGRRLRAWAKAR